MRWLARARSADRCGGRRWSQEPQCGDHLCLGAGGVQRPASDGTRGSECPSAVAGDHRTRSRPGNLGTLAGGGAGAGGRPSHGRDGTGAAANPPPRCGRHAMSTAPPHSVEPVRALAPPSRNVAALDKHLDLFMAQSLARADAGKTKDLKASEIRFLKRRDACRSEACQTAAYVGQMRTISKIMAR